MPGCQAIPADLTEIPPGPRLAAVLDELDLSRLSAFDCVEVLKARYRQVSHDRAQLMAVMVEVGLCRPGPDELARMAIPDEFSADEIRAALVLTRRAAEDQFWLAYDLLTRLPAVHAALDRGRLDEPRARVLSDWTTGLTEEQAQALSEELLPRAPGLTTGQLIEQIKKMAIAIDPEWARRRYEEAVAERRVVGSRNPDGSANLSGQNLPVDRVAAACGRIDALAKAAKRAGDLRRIDHIRAELFLGMTDGTYTGLDDTAILAHLSTTQHTGHPDPECPRNNSGRNGSNSDDSNPDDSGPDDSGPDDSGPDDSGPDDSGPDGGGGSDGDLRGDESGGESGDGVAGDAGVGVGAEKDASSAVRGLGERGGLAEVGMELRVRLSTLLGLDQCPGELAGWGPVHAELARDLAATLGRGQWRFVVTDAQGRLLSCGITSVRPTASLTRSAGSRQIIELQVPAAALGVLAGDLDSLGDWAAVVSDMAHQYRNARVGHPPDGDPHRRSPGAELRRWVQIRDRFCVMIGCRTPAQGTDTDHTLDHARGGATLGPNLGGACRHDHRLKHEGGWQLHQPEPGLFCWTSRSGHTYRRHPPPIIEPLPDPIPGYCAPPPMPASHNDENDAGIWDDHDATIKPSSRPPPDPNADDVPPPF